MNMLYILHMVFVIIRNLCLARDDYHHPEHLLSCNEIKELIE